MFSTISLLIIETFTIPGFLNFTNLLSNNPYSFLYTLLLLVVIQIFFLLITKRPFITGGIELIITIILTTLSYIKSQIREFPFLPPNIKLLKELFITIWIEPYFLLLTLIGLLIGVYMILKVFKLEKKEFFNFGIEIYLFYLTLTISLIVTLVVTFPFNTTDKFIDEMRLNGYVSTFINYSKGKNIIENVYENEIVKANTPLIILVVRESYLDPQDFKKINLSQDPIRFERNLKNNSIYGYTKVQGFGANTTASEFEILTGISLTNFSPDTTGFTDILKKQTPSIASYLSSQGFDTYSIHLSPEYFLNERTAYNLLGFETIIMEDDLINPKRKGTYISDEQSLDVVFDILKKGEEKQFIYLMTVQNHFDFEYNLVESFLNNEILTRKEYELLNSYLTGLRDSDLMLEKLVYTLEKDGRDYLLILASDHLPFLGFNNSIYKKLEYDINRLHFTPFLIYSKNMSEKKNLGDISLPYLGIIPYVEFNELLLPNGNQLLKQFERGEDLGISSDKTKK
jgi:hypothetical protein